MSTFERQRESEGRGQCGGDCRAGYKKGLTLASLLVSMLSVHSLRTLLFGVGAVLTCLVALAFPPETLPTR
mgnify:CR=1 FL=1